MNQHATFDTWTAAAAYDAYMGRWSRLIAQSFVDWLDVPAGAHWLEVGCGTGALTQEVVSRCAPASLMAVDPMAEFVACASTRIPDSCAEFRVAAAPDLPVQTGTADVATAGLVLNDVADPVAALKAMARAVRPGGTVSFYVWDYAGGGMGMIDAFWSTASLLDPAADILDEAVRYGQCSQSGLLRLCAQAGLEAEATAIETTTEFSDFNDFWAGFRHGDGAAPGYCDSLTRDQRMALKTRLETEVGEHGAVRLPARAWALKAQVAA